MGDGISFPQRHMDEDEDSLLGGRDHHRWAEEGGVENNTRTDANPYRNCFYFLFKKKNNFLLLFNFQSFLSQML